MLLYGHLSAYEDNTYIYISLYFNIFSDFFFFFTDFQITVYGLYIFKFKEWIYTYTVEDTRGIWPLEVPNWCWYNGGGGINQKFGLGKHLLLASESSITSPIIFLFLIISNIGATCYIWFFSLKPPPLSAGRGEDNQMMHWTKALRFLPPQYL